jgi:signal transduction histidine kinase
MTRSRLAQFATAAHQHLEAFASHHRPRTPWARGELDRARELAQWTVREARRLIGGLWPMALDDFGLATALCIEAETLRAEGWQITYDEELGPERLPPTIEIALFRVAQAALENVRNHAQTTRMHLALERGEQIVRMEVRDWGCGFRPSAVLASSGPSERVGLPGMQERIAWLGGRCTVRSRPGAGTRVVVEVWLPAPAVGAADGPGGSRDAKRHSSGAHRRAPGRDHPPPGTHRTTNFRRTAQGRLSCSMRAAAR